MIGCCNSCPVKSGSFPHLESAESALVTTSACWEHNNGSCAFVIKSLGSIRAKLMRSLSPSATPPPTATKVQNEGGGGPGAWRGGVGLWQVK